MTTDRPKIIAPPPLLFAVCVAGAVIIDHFKPLPIVSDMNIPRYVAGAIVFLIAIAIGSTAIRQFRAHKEHPSPYKPTNVIVDSGIYRFTRNPIYMSFFVVALAVAIVGNSWWVVLSVLPLFLLLHFGVVVREEEYLSAKFGEPYDDYRRRVRRWL